MDSVDELARAARIDPVAVTRALVDIDSTTGSESAASEWIARFLELRGFSVLRQPVDGGRVNVLATLDTPAVVLSTHIDCVPPFFPSRIEGDRLYGRGACDAKGILAAQVAAADALRLADERRIGVLVVVGEERGSDGARAANGLAPAGCRFLIDGEPTDTRLGLGTRGALRLRFRASGRAAHSAYPELGESAIEKLLDALVALRRIELPSDDVMGRTHYTVGLINGGLAPNVIPPAAEAEVMFRTVGEGRPVIEALEPLAPAVAIETVLEVPAVRLITVDGYDTAVFSFTTDIPYLTRWGQPLLFGPGSIHVAHTAEEHVHIPELITAVEHYITITRELLER